MLLQSAIASVPAGAWAVGISGGADSVALTDLLRTRHDLKLHLVHLDHELRDQESRDDAASVAELARRWGLPCLIARRHELQQQITAALPVNPQARYRELRLHLFGQVVADGHLAGVLLAHHAGDQAETVLLRLARGAGLRGLAGIPSVTQIRGLTIRRPLLGVPPEMLRSHLREASIPWREDSSNASGKYLRNRVRAYLSTRSELASDLVALAGQVTQLNAWIAARSPELERSFAVAQVRGLPAILARDALRNWLTSRGADADNLSIAVVDRLREMVEDAAAPARADFPGGLRVGRRGGKIASLSPGVPVFTGRALAKSCLPPLEIAKAQESSAD